MLEANTDRSYFMIGAVIVAAIIIAAVSWLFRDLLFAAPTGTGPTAYDNAGIVPKLVNSVFTKASSMITGLTATTQK